MLKQKVYKWKDTNLALIGSDLDKQARLDSAETETAWNGTGEGPELRVWRIEQFKVKAWPESKYGQFHTGDSYIILHTYKQSEDTEKLLYDIFFWIGAETSQDEYGTAAYKTVELDAKFNDAAVQHREVQNHESEPFKRLFEGKIEYLEGGVESGFNHVGEPENPAPELFRVKGTAGNIEFKQVKLRKDSLNSDDVFILDTWTVLYQWNGKGSNPAEKLKAGQYLDSVVSARGKDTKKVVLEEGNEGEEFWSFIPASWTVGCIPLATYDVQEHARQTDDQVRAFRKQLYRLRENGNGELGFSRVTKADMGRGNKIAQAYLRSDDVYILDDGFIVWVWIGKEASGRERGGGFNYAMKYIKKHKRPVYMPINQVREGQEPLTFKEHLHDGPTSGCVIS